MQPRLITILFAMALQSGSAQTLDKFADQLYFGMLSYHPDTSIKAFITKYVPVVLKKFDSGKWTSYPPIAEPAFQTVTNSYVFYTHPYLQAKFRSGVLAITQKLYDEPKWLDNITDIKLWFEFDNEMDAKTCYDKLVAIFSGFKVVKRIKSKHGAYVAEFTDQDSDKYYRSIQIIFAKDYFIRKNIATPTGHGLKISTTTGYKILIEIGDGLN